MSDASQSTTIRALLAVQRARRSGVFTVQDGETQTRMHLLRGDFVCAEQGAPSDELGLVLVRAKMMTEEQRCAAHAALPKGADDPIRFAQVAVALHILQPAQVPDALALQTRERAIHCLMLERSSWSFREGDEQGSRPGDSPTPIEPLVLAAARRLEPRHLERILALEQDRPVRLLVEAEALAMRFRMNGAQAHFLHRVDGSRTARALCTAASRDLPEAAALLAALVLSGDAELAPERPTTLTGLSVPTPNPSVRALAASALHRLHQDVTRRTPQPFRPTGKMAAIPAPTAPAPTPDTRRTILVVDDEEAVRTLVARSLSQRFQIVEAADGMVALELLGRIPPPSLIVMDVNMPHVDGLSVATKLKNEPSLKHVPIIFLTARTAPADLMKGIQVGAKHYLTKPFSITMLLEKIDKILK